MLVPEGRRVPALRPVELVLTQTCRFKHKDCAECGKAKSNRAHRKKDGDHPYKRTMGCARCGRLKKDDAHLEVVPSLRMLGSGDPRTYMAMKERLEEAFTEALDESGLPRGLEGVTVEAMVTIGDRSKRDEGNVRFFLEKALGDALVAGGWLEDDQFYPVRRYSFGQIQAQHDPGVVAELRLMIFPG
jgi:hypothetical protein